MVTIQENDRPTPSRARPFRRPLELAAAAFLAERQRWPLWLPVFYGTGIGCYFLPAAEPPPWLGAIFLAGSLLAVLVLVPILNRPARRTALVLLLPLPVLAAGFAVAQWHAHEKAAPVLARQVGPLMVAGRISAVEPLEQAGRWRVTMTDPRFPGREGRLPALRKVRLTVRTGGVEPVVGSRMQVLAILFPPGTPDLPGGFDFARTAWFQQLGAVGFSLSPLSMSGSDMTEEAALATRIRERVARLRAVTTQRILAALPGPEGAVAAALLTGERGAIPARVVASYRDSGIAHLLAISGLHLALVAGLLFFGIRAALAAWPRLALRYPIKKWAALAALAGALAYLMLTGAAVSTQRATLMAALVFLAIVLDRQAISMRSVALAAFVVLTLAPQDILTPGFQMSFSAVIALVAAYEGQRVNRLTHRLAERGGWPAHGVRLLVYLTAILLTTVIAGLATAPYAAFHFHRLVDYGQVANLIAVPVTSFWVMPMGVLAYVLMPLGLEELALLPMGWGIALVNETAARISAWPGAVRSVPAMPMAALLAMTFGALWLLLWRRPWRYAGIGGVALGLWLALQVSPPDLLADAEGRTFAVRLQDSLVYQSSTAARRRIAESWGRSTGLEAAAAWPEIGLHPLSDEDARLRCDSEGCLYIRAGRTIALPFSQDALVRDCGTSDALVAGFAVLQRCPVPEGVFDARFLYRQGGMALSVPPIGPIRIETVAMRRGHRLWSGPDVP